MTFTSRPNSSTAERFFAALHRDASDFATVDLPITNIIQKSTQQVDLRSEAGGSQIVVQ